MNLKNIKLSQNASFWLVGLLLLLAFSGTYLLRPILDPDFFWHLKTGEWIWQNGRLPTFDPFTFTGPQSPDARQLFILQGYPLSQLLYYGLHEAFGWTGLFLLRFILAIGFFAMFLARFTFGNAKHQSALLAGGLLLLFFPFFFECYPLDRPQIFSFLFFGFLLLLYDLAVRREQRRPLLTIALPSFLLTAVWGNLHGGYLAGIAVLLLLGGVEAVLFLYKRRSRAQGIAILCLVLAGVAGAFLNHNSLDLAMIKGLFAVNTQPLYVYNNEFLSTIEYHKIFSDNTMVVLWIFMFVVGVLISFTTNLDNLAETLLLLGVGGYAFMYVRHIPFFVVAAIPIVYSRLLRNKLPKLVPYVVTVVCLAIFVGYAVDEFENGKLLAEEGAVSREMPIAAANFIVHSNLHGRIFNSYGWGGYLLWRLAPERKIYQDGRALEQKVLIDWLTTLLNMKSGSGRPMWQEILDKYAIDLAVLPTKSEERPGEPHELAVAMSNDPGWRVVYYDQVAIILIRTKGQ